MVDLVSVRMSSDGLPCWLGGEESAQCGNAGSILGLGKILEKEVADLTQYSLLEEFPWTRSLVGYSPRGAMSWI